MKRALSNNRAGHTPRDNLSIESGLVLLSLLVFLVGCETIDGMTGIDKFYQDEGYTLHCTEVAGDTCLTRQWFKEPQNTYQRYHNKGETNE